MNKMSGICVDIGDTLTTVTPCIDTKEITDRVQRVNFGGRDLTKMVVRLLGSTGHNFYDFTGHWVCNQIKEKECRVLLKSYNPHNVKYRLPDNRTIDLDQEILRVPECLFTPSAYGIPIVPLH